MPVLKNKGTCPFDVAGVVIRPGRTGEVSAEQIESFTSNPAGKAIFKTSLEILGEEKEVIKSDDTPQDDKEGAPATLGGKDELLEEAKALGLKVNKNYGEKKLSEMIAEAKSEGGESEEAESEE